MLEVQGIHTYYGLSHILFNVSLSVPQGKVVCLLGRNGAGKTTTLKSIMGLAAPARGRIHAERGRRHRRGALPARPQGHRLRARRPPDIRGFDRGGEPGDRRPAGVGVRRLDKERVYDLFPPLKPMDSAARAGCSAAASRSCSPSPAR